jgi:hypothetical protein
MKVLEYWVFQLPTNVSIFGIFLHFFIPEKNDSDTDKTFLWKNDPNLLDFNLFFKKITRFLQTGGQNIIGLFFIKRLSHLFYSQIWLNLFVDNHQFGLVFFFLVQNFAKMWKINIKWKNFSQKKPLDFKKTSFWEKFHHIWTLILVQATKISKTWYMGGFLSSFIGSLLICILLCIVIPR